MEDCLCLVSSPGNDCGAVLAFSVRTFKSTNVLTNTKLAKATNVISIHFYTNQSVKVRGKNQLIVGVQLLKKEGTFVIIFNLDKN